MLSYSAIGTMIDAIYARADHAEYTAGGTQYTAQFNDVTVEGGVLSLFFILSGANINGKTITRVAIADANDAPLAEKTLRLTGGSADVTYRYMISIIAEDE